MNDSSVSHLGQGEGGAGQEEPWPYRVLHVLDRHLLALSPRRHVLNETKGQARSKAPGYYESTMSHTSCDTVMGHCHHPERFHSPCGQEKA